MTLGETMLEKFLEHDCHASEEDGCRVCDEYKEYTEMRVRNRRVRLEVKWSNDNLPPQSYLEKVDNNIIGGSSRLWAK